MILICSTAKGTQPKVTFKLLHPFSSRARQPQTGVEFAEVTDNLAAQQTTRRLATTTMLAPLKRAENIQPANTRTSLRAAIWV